MNSRKHGKGLVRPYVVTEGRAYPTDTTLDLITLVRATGTPSPPDLAPEKRRIMLLCRGGSLSLAEIAARLELPVSVTKVLVADLMDSGQLAAFAAPPPTQQHDIRLLERILDGLRALS